MTDRSAAEGVGSSFFGAAVYEEAFRSTANPALLTDTNFVIRDINQRGLEFLGYGYDEIVGQSATVLTNDRPLYESIVENLVNDEPWEGEFKARTKDDEVVIGQGSTAPVYVDGAKRGYIAIFIDTTKERRYEYASKVLSRLLRHDLRNDLNVIYGRIQQAKSKTDDDEVIENLAISEEMVRKTVNKSEKARDFRELLEESHEISNRPVRLDLVLNDRVVKLADRFERADFRFEPFPEIRVVADELLPYAIESVLENAVIHNDSPTPVVELVVDERDADVVLGVRDNGPGVPDGEEDLIFGREELDPLHHGQGISLFFTDRVIDSYGGEIWVEDNDPDGSVFRIRLDKLTA